MHRIAKIGQMVFFIAMVPLFGQTTMPPSSGHHDLRMSKILHQEAPGMTAPARQQLMQSIMRVAEDYAIDPLLILAIVRIESHFQTQARSHANAIGLMQIRAIVVRDVADELDVNPNHAHRLLTDAHQNVRIGVHYFASLLERFNHDVVKALLAYNQGPTSVARAYGTGPITPRGYAAKVLNTYQRYRKV